METRVAAETEEWTERHYSSGIRSTVVSGMEKYIEFLYKNFNEFSEFSFV